MSYAYKEKKSIRKDFGCLANIMDIPYPLAKKLDSYSKFIQDGI